MIYQKNLEALKQNRPELLNSLVGLKTSGRYQIRQSNNIKKIPNLLDKKTGKLYYDNADPLGSVQKNILERDIRVPQLSVFLGMGLSYNLVHMQFAYNKAPFNYVVIEKDPEIFITAIHTIDMTNVINDPRFIFIVGVPIENMYTYLYSVLMDKNNKLFVKAVNIIEEPCAFMAEKEYYIGCIQTLKNAARDVINYYGNDPHDSLIGIQNTLINIKEIINHPGIKDLKDKFKGRPGIVVATGPSLDKNIEQLRGLEDKAIICAADASLRVMKQYDIKPHFVTSLERVEATAKLFENFTEEETKGVYLAACPVLHPKTYENYPGKRIVTYRDFATFKWIDIEKGTLGIGPSAGNMAFKVLEYLGCDPIILMGQDLAFGENDHTHAKGSTYGQNDVKPNVQILEVEGNLVPKLKTTPVWRLFLNHYIVEVQEYKGKVINATEGGAKIPGTEFIPFSEAAERYINNLEPINVENIIEQNLQYPNEQEKELHKKQVIEKVDMGIKYCESTIDFFKEMLELINVYDEVVKIPFEAGEKIDDKRGEELSVKIQNGTQRFGEPDFHNILMHFVQSFYIRTTIDVYEIAARKMDKIKNNIDIIHKVKELYIVTSALIERILHVFYVMKKILEEEK